MAAEDDCFDSFLWMFKGATLFNLASCYQIIVLLSPIMFFFGSPTRLVLTTLGAIT